MSGPWEDFQAQDGPWADFRPAAKPRPKRRRSLTADVTGFMANVNRGLPGGDELAAGAQTAVNVFAGRTPIQDVGDDFKRSLKAQRGYEDEFAAARPRAAALGRGTGLAVTAALPVGGTANLFAQGSRAVNAARGATLAATEAAVYAAADRGTAAERLSAASRAARDPVTLGLGAVAGRMATPARPRARKPVDPNVKLLAEEGVRMTPGQMGGRIRKTAEDAATSLPFVGDAIAERRTEGIETFSRAVVNRALKPLGTKLPDDVPNGTAAVKYAGDLLSRGYDEAIPSRIIRADPGFADDVRTALGQIDTLTPKHKARLSDILDQRVTSRLPPTGQMDGQLYKQIQSDLDYEVARFQGAGDPDARAIGDALAGVQRALESAARRQDPQFAAKIDALDRGWAELARIETAASKSADLSGVFTPSQYAQSIRSADNRVRKRGVARGEAMSQDLARAGVKVLPSKMPDSGTAGRAAWGMVASAPGAVLGAVTGGGAGALAGIAGTGASLAALARRYTPQAVEAANVALNERISREARMEALQALAEMAARNPRIAELHRQVAARLSRAAGVQGGARAGQAEQQRARNIFAEP